jgi:hypothetical protein
VLVDKRESDQGVPARGAYGLRLDGLRAASLGVAGDDWPLLAVERRIGNSEADMDSMDESQARLKLRNGGEITLSRDPLRALFTVPFELRDAELVHPYLAPAAAAVGWWLGRESFHGGGVVVGDVAFGILGGREAGKSSLLAWLAQRGMAVLSDDVVVTDARRVAFAGPRTIDLRAPAAAALSAGENLGVVGARERWRLELPPLPGTVRLGGWFFLDWDRTSSVRRLKAHERLPLLLASRAVRLPAADDRLLLELAALPAWELRRPRDWRHLPQTAGLLRETIGLAADA